MMIAKSAEMRLFSPDPKGMLCATENVARKSFDL
jgi:hypothetical protein